MTGPAKGRGYPCQACMWGRGKTGQDLGQG